MCTGRGLSAASIKSTPETLKIMTVTLDFSPTHDFFDHKRSPVIGLDDFGHTYTLAGEVAKAYPLSGNFKLDGKAIMPYTSNRGGGDS